MKYRFINLFILLTLHSFGLTGQYDFEDWESTFREPPLAMEKPVGMTTTNDVFPFIGLSAFKTSESYSGMYAVRLRSKKILGEYFRGGLVIGDANIDYLNLGFDVLSNGVEVTTNIGVISYYYKNTIEQKDDNGLLKIIIYRPSTNTIVYEQIDSLPSTNTWTQYQTNFDYTHQSGDSMHIQLFSGINPDNELFIDDLHYSFLSSTTEADIVTNDLIIYPNPISSEDLHRLIFENAPSDSDVKIYDLLGKLHYAGRLNQSHSLVSPPILNVGKYLITIGAYNKLLVISN